MKCIKNRQKKSRRVVKELAKHDDEYLFNLAFWIYSCGANDVFNNTVDFDIEEETSYVKGLVLERIYG